MKGAAKAHNEAFQEAFLSDRKYRQRGYQDSGASRKEVEKAGEAGGCPAGQYVWTTSDEYAWDADGLALRRVRSDAGEFERDLGQCPKCGFDLHACKQCEHFDPSSRFECSQPIPERISPKDKRNDCTFYSIRVRLEKETSSKQAQRPNDARQAFENLFKK